MGGTSYRVPTFRSSRIERRWKDQFCRHDLDADAIDHHGAGEWHRSSRHPAVPIRGAAWQATTRSTGRGVVRCRSTLAHDADGEPKNRYDWVRWTGTLALPSDGYFELWVRATDSRGIASRMWRRTGIRKVMAQIRSTALRCWWGDMRMLGRSLAAAFAITVTAAFSGDGVAQTASATEETPESLPDFKGREETFGYCIGCHSFRVVGRQGMDRARWDETLRFMTKSTTCRRPTTRRASSCSTTWRRRILRARRRKPAAGSAPLLRRSDWCPPASVVAADGVAWRHARLGVRAAAR